MTPTPKLRFVEREKVTVNQFSTSYQKIRILQQWWEPERNIIDAVAEKKTQGEWRDIPVETEA